MKGPGRAKAMNNLMTTGYPATGLSITTVNISASSSMEHVGKNKAGGADNKHDALGEKTNSDRIKIISIRILSIKRNGKNLNFILVSYS